MKRVGRNRYAEIGDKVATPDGKVGVVVDVSPAQPHVTLGVRTDGERKPYWKDDCIILEG